MNEAVLEIAAATGTPVIDAQALFTARSESGITGSEWLLDHVHPGIEGHQLLADCVADQLVTMQIVKPAEDWQSARQQGYEEHLASLSDLYFHEGAQRLEAVRVWAQGRTTHERSEDGTDPETAVP